ncbi:hydroxyacylglutathione hydrolase [Afifella sp. IM 167]|uniref:hydroxyacylglutathione hydrolase n=1 Tax=Afifella sp. IM 167 TaxID=2033586 RepID=UPI001CCE1257|nr:hydroxyacylglutathione hydrolase [Afifella sp. IM 167]MBZ8132853.1 hydroxyacylglutathione hydrolase [Afifella sp. IM 167]
MAALEIVQLPARSDNYAVLVHDPETGATVAIDAPEAEPIIETLKAREWVLTDIFVTHKHFDHVEGVPALRDAYSARTIGPRKSAAATGLYDKTVGDGESFQWAGRKVEVIATPGHTLDHVAYYVPQDGLAFVGDTLFALGCGRVFEGSAEEMWASLKALRDLPDETIVYCGHEYTLANAEFAASIDPQNEVLIARKGEIEALRAEGEPTLPTTIGTEKATNPFLRADDPELQRVLGMEGEEPAAVFAEIRQRKDRF